MQEGKVYRNSILVGIIVKHDNETYSFKYENDYLENNSPFAVCLAMPTRDEPYVSNNLFPFFFGLLSEGAIKDLQCEKYRLDKNDDFSRLLKTSSSTIGSITIKEIKSEQ